MRLLPAYFLIYFIAALAYTKSPALGVVIAVVFTLVQLSLTTPDQAKRGYGGEHVPDSGGVRLVKIVGKLLIFVALLPVIGFAILFIVCMTQAKRGF